MLGSTFSAGDACQVSISPSQLAALLGGAKPPVVLDVRPVHRYEASPQAVATAVRVAPDGVAEFASTLAHTPNATVVVYCTYGHHVGQTAALTLRQLGVNALFLQGGFEGGEPGVDDDSLLAEWRKTKLPLVAKTGATTP